MTDNTEEELRSIYANTKTIAVVGASADESKDSHRIPAYLQGLGYKIIPVNPKGGTIFGERAFASLGEIDVGVDVVEVFRPSEETPQVAKEAAAIGAKVLWLQTGIESEEAEAIAKEAGMILVMDRCMRATHKQLELGPAPS